MRSPRSWTTERRSVKNKDARSFADSSSMYGVIPVLRRRQAGGHQADHRHRGLRGPAGMADKEGKADADYHHMILLARDDVGYRNLLALTAAAQVGD